MKNPELSDIQLIVSSVSVLFLLLIAGLWLRRRSAFLTRLFLPGSVIAGVITLCLGPDVLGAFLRSINGPDAAFSNGLFSEEMSSVWRSLPSMLINIVFACLFLGKSIPNPKEIWRQAGPVVCYGQAIAWGQYVVGLLLAIAILVPFFDMNPMVGALIEIGFEGGHGTAAGLAPVFESLGFEEGIDLALGLASIGLLSAILSGVVLINWARRKGMLLEEDTVSEVTKPAKTAQPQETARTPEKSDREAIDPMSMVLGLVAASITIGAILLELLQMFERATWGKNGLELLAHVPLFPMAMIGGAIVQIVVSKIWGENSIDRAIVSRISGVSLDLVIVAALGTISLLTIANNFLPFLLMACAGAAWNILGFLYLAPRLIPGPWFERGIPNFGQSMGMTVTGLMLFQMADPDNKSGGLERFGYKQLLFEPVVGGGLFTAMSLPLIFEFGPWFVLGLTSVLLAFWIWFGHRIARSQTHEEET